MNYKTTIILLVLLVGIGLAVFFSRDKTKPEDKHETHKLVDIKTGDVTAISVTDPDGKTWAADKTAKADGSPVWHFANPKSIIADKTDIESLLDELTALKSTAQSSASAAATGVDHPQYTIVVTTTGGKVSTIQVGQPVVDGVYVHVDSATTTDVVSSSILSTLDRPGADKPRMHLFDLQPTAVAAVTVTKPDQPPITLTKTAGNWSVSSPTSMPADSADASSLVSAVTDLEPTTVVDEKVSAQYGLNDPVATVDLQSETAGSPSTKIRIGRYQDIEQKNIYIGLPNNLVATVPATLMTWVDKKPVEYHDRSVLKFEPADVKKIRITTTVLTTQPAATQPSTQLSTTQPAVVKMPMAKPMLAMSPAAPATMPVTTQPASTMPATTMPATTEPAVAPVAPPVMVSKVTQVVMLTQRVPRSAILDTKFGPPAPVGPATTRPTTGPTSMPATMPTTAPTTMPAEPETKWVLEHDAPADDARVTALLSTLSTLRADKFLDPVPPARPGKTYDVELGTDKPEKRVLHVFDPGDGGPLIGSIDGLTFELSSSVANDLSGDFKPGSAPPPTPSMSGMEGMPGMGGMPGMPPGMMRRGR